MNNYSDPDSLGPAASRQGFGAPKANRAVRAAGFTGLAALFRV